MKMTRVQMGLIGSLWVVAAAGCGEADPVPNPGRIQISVQGLSNATTQFELPADSYNVVVAGTVDGSGNATMTIDARDDGTNSLVATTTFVLSNADAGGPNPGDTGQSTAGPFTVSAGTLLKVQVSFVWLGAIPNGGLGVEISFSGNPDINDVTIQPGPIVETGTTLNLTVDATNRTGLDSALSVNANLGAASQALAFDVPTNTFQGTIAAPALEVTDALRIDVNDVVFNRTELSTAVTTVGVGELPTTLENDPGDSVSIVLSPGAGTTDATVTLQESGAPVANAPVVVIDANRPDVDATGLTDAAGQVVLSIPRVGVTSVRYMASWDSSGTPHVVWGVLP
jgi:hypothetical protein